MKTLVPFIPLYLLTLAGLVLIVKSFISMFIRPKVKSIDYAIILDESENYELYETFSE